MRAPLSILLTVGMVSCTAPQHNFASMTEAELLAYNADRPVLKQIYCQKDEADFFPHPQKRMQIG